MDSMVDSRYLVDEVIRESSGRMIYSGLDTFSDRAVILKEDAVDFIHNELSILLSLPPGVGSEILDVFYLPNSDRAIVVLEKLSGKTLLEAAPEIPEDSIPALVEDIAQALFHLHRAGFVHVDLKPGNIFALSEADHGSIRLLDFGFSGGTPLPSGFRFEGAVGGTLPFLAPEVERGWSIDGRADIYSLGLTLKTLFPALENQRAWSTILSKMTQSSPSSRYPHITAFHEALKEAFPPKNPKPWRPRWCSGSLRGREREMDLIQAMSREIKKPARILIQGWSGTGLTRFLLEGMLTWRNESEQPMRCIDLSTSGGVTCGDRIAPFIEERIRMGETVLCGVPDLSPGLHWSESEIGVGIRKIVQSGGWSRFPLSPIRSDAFVDVVAETLGGGGAEIEAYGLFLYEQTEGDFKAAAERFSVTTFNVISEDAKRWKPDGDRIVQDRPSNRPVPISFNQIPESKQRSVQICARAGEEIPTETLLQLFTRFADKNALADLCDLGILRPSDSGSHDFVSRRLRSEILKISILDQNEIDHWLNENLKPRIDDPPQVLEACRRAGSLGDRSRESRFLKESIEYAFNNFNWTALLKLFSYTKDGSGSWTAELVWAHAKDLMVTANPAKSEGQLVFMMSRALSSVNPPVAVQLWETLAHSSEQDICSKALILLIEKSLEEVRIEDYKRYMSSVEGLDREGYGPRPGVLHLKKARYADHVGDYENSLKLIQEGVDLLRGTGSVHEILGLQQLAISIIDKDPDQAVEYMRAAMAAAPTVLLAVQVHYNLTRMQSMLGYLEASAETADAGLRLLSKTSNPRWVSQLREQRASTWSCIDRVEDALSESVTLLQDPLVQRDPVRKIILGCLVGFCFLHQGRSNDAIGHLARVWEDSSHGCPLYVQAFTLNYIVDALLDLRAWNLVNEYGSGLRFQGEKTTPQSIAAEARAEALCAQAGGDLSAAAEKLIANEPEIRKTGEPEAISRYLYHLGIVKALDSGRAGKNSDIKSAEEYLRESLAILPKDGYRYYRGRIFLCLAGILNSLGKTAAAGAMLTEAIDLARRIGSRGLLADGLESRARLNLGNSL